MLPAQNRLRQRRDFKRVYQRNRSVAVPCLVLYWRKTGRGPKRIGFSVSKKLGKAVQRNRVKRRLRAAARELLPAFPSGHDVIFVARAAAREADTARLTAEMARALALMKSKMAVNKS